MVQVFLGDSFHTTSKPVFKLFDQSLPKIKIENFCLYVGNKLFCSQASFILLGLLGALAANEHLMGLSECLNLLSLQE